MKRKLLLFCFSLLSLNLFSQPVPYTYNYTLTNTSPTFHRPLTTTILSSVGTAVYYNTFKFTPSITGSYTFTNLCSTMDGFGCIYQSPFNPASPLANVLAVDDDGGSGVADNDYLITITLTAGVSYTLVSTTFLNGETGSGSTVITGPALATLPLRWLQVGGLINQQNKAIITWTVEEIQVAWYQLERSDNGIDFTTVSRIASNGDGVNKYSITDPNAINDKAYYRILQQDANGKITYSTIIQLRVANKGVTIFPNPARDQIQVSVGNNLLNTNLQLITLNGLILKTIKILQSNFIINLNQYMPGIYFLRFEDGSINKLVVNE